MSHFILAMTGTKPAAMTWISVLKVELREIQQFLRAPINSADGFAPNHHGISHRNSGIAHGAEGFGQINVLPSDEWAFHFVFRSESALCS